MKLHIRLTSLQWLPALLFITCLGCKKFVAIDPPKTQVVTASVFSNDGTAKSAVDGIFSQMITGSGFASGNSTSLTFIGGLSADEFINYSSSPDQSNFYRNALDANNSIVYSSLWQAPYQYIYYANAVLEGLAASTGVSATQNKELQGEAKFIRAFCTFYLVNMFGDIPLVLTTDYRINSTLARTSSPIVYQAIVTDLKDAQTLLADDYSFSAGERIRPNRKAATALLARTYLYMKDWANAELNATMVINSSTYSLLPDLNQVFKKNSMEAIWQLMPVSPGNNTYEGSNFILTASPTNVAISPSLLNAFETGDNRKTNWVGSITVGSSTFSFPYKYKIKGTGQPLTEYSMMLRLAEQYLIRAEARAQQNNIAGAQADINIIRNRAGLSNTTANTQITLTDAIIHEKQIELFAEWGHRWLDIKRSGKADMILAAIKSPNWQSNDVLFPIPISEIKNDLNLVQNPGY